MQVTLIAARTAAAYLDGSFDVTRGGVGEIGAIGGRGQTTGAVLVWVCGEPADAGPHHVLVKLVAHGRSFEATLLDEPVVFGARGRTARAIPVTLSLSVGEYALVAFVDGRQLATQPLFVVADDSPDERSEPRQP